VPAQQVNPGWQKDYCGARFGAFSPGGVPSSQGIDIAAVQINDQPVINKTILATNLLECAFLLRVSTVCKKDSP
jgi:hypothetical protein